MTTPHSATCEERVLVLAPTPSDAALSRSILTDSGLAAHICNDAQELGVALGEGAGAALLTEDVLTAGDAYCLIEAVQCQPSWSDLPILLLSESKSNSPAATFATELLGNVTILERPVRVTNLISALRTAIRARRRQYELRDQMQALQQSEERLRLALEFGELGLWEWDIVSGEIRALHYARKLLGPRTRGNIKDSLAILHPDDRERVWQALEAAVRGESLYEIEYRVTRADGQLRWLAAKGQVLRDQHNRPLRMLGVNYDITDRKQGEDALREADARKDKFLATLAHELRNPLAPIRNALQIMRLARDDRATVEHARSMMERQLGQMVRLIDDLLDVSRITRGRLELRKERVDLAAVINSAVETVRPLIDACGHRLHIALPPQPVHLEADSMRLAQVFSNLLNNAAKYMDPDGDIWLSVRHHGDHVSIAVRDTGIGIPPAALPTVFDIFMQVDPTMEKSSGGLGIGLMLVKQLLEMHDGSIEARSDGVGRGAEFIARLPLAAAPASAPAEALRSAPRGPQANYRIMVADDNGDAAESMGAMLRIMGNEVRIVRDGVQAIEEAAVFRPDVALLDIGMPRANGYEAARRIREHDWGRRMVLVAITGWGQDDDKRKAAEAGFDQHFTKPVSPTEVESLIGGLHAHPRLHHHDLAEH